MTWDIWTVVIPAADKSDIQRTAAPTRSRCVNFHPKHHILTVYTPPWLWLNLCLIYEEPFEVLGSRLTLHIKICDTSLFSNSWHKLSFFKLITKFLYILFCMCFYQGFTNRTLFCHSRFKVNLKFSFCQFCSC